MNGKEVLPNAVATLVLGICSIVFGCFFIGLVLGIIGLAISGKPKKLYEQTPERYDGMGMLTAGRVMSIIGICLGGLYAMYYIVVVAIMGAAASTIWHMHH